MESEMFSSFDTTTTTSTMSCGFHAVKIEMKIRTLKCMRANPWLLFSKIFQLSLKKKLSFLCFLSFNFYFKNWENFIKFTSTSLIDFNTLRCQLSKNFNLSKNNTKSCNYEFALLWSSATISSAAAVIVKTWQMLRAVSMVFVHFH